MLLGTSSEVVGYVGRVLLHSNPYSTARFEMQICTLGLGPAFWSAAIYLTLKHEVNVLGRQFSLLRAEWYSWIFITCDLISLSLQGAGGGLAASAGHDIEMQNAGSSVMLAGVVWQVVTLTVFAVISVHFFLQVKTASKIRLSREAREVWESRKFWVFCWGVGISFFTTYARCVYCIAEMAGGWRNPILQDEIGFIVLESAMCSVAVVALCITHPAYCFR
ncbi:RTA-like protein [Aspergillus spectabilis]